MSAAVSPRDVLVSTGPSFWNLRFDGASPSSTLAPGNELRAMSSTMSVGPTGSRTERTFANARFAGLYRGIDAEMRGDGASLALSYTLQPGADPGHLRLDLGAKAKQDGAGGASITRSDGACVVRVAASQKLDGQTQAVPARVGTNADGLVGIDLGSYDVNRSVNITELVTFSTYLGGANSPTNPNEFAFAVASGADGSIYVTGATQSTSFPVTSGAVQSNTGGQTDAFVSKLDPNSGSLVYSTYIGGSGDDQGYGIVVDSSGNAYVVGTTNSPNFPTANAIDGTIGTFTDAFALKLNPSGTALVYSTYLGGGSASAGVDTAYACTLDGGNNLYVAGSTASSDFPMVNAADSTINGGIDAFVAKINAAGSALVYSTFLGGLGTDEAFGISVDGSGRAIISGETASSNFPVVSPIQANFGGSSDCFVARYSANGSSVEFATYLGGSQIDDGSSVLVDGNGNVYVTGHTLSTNFPTQLPVQAESGGGSDAYVAKLAPSGGSYSLAFSTYLGGSADDLSYGVVMDSSGRIVIAGVTGSSNFPVANAMDSTFGGAAGTADAFVVRINVSGTPSIDYSTFLGGTLTEDGFALAAVPNGVVIAGFTESSNFPTFQAYDTSLGGTRDVFVTRISTPGIGADTAGIYVPSSGAYFLKNANAGGGADLVFTYGAGGAGLVPLRGDWNGDGFDSQGLYDPSTGAFFLKNTSAPGAADIAFTFGSGGAGIVPLTGDWNGDGIDTIGLYVASTGTFFLRNSNSPGAADVAFSFGAGGSVVPVVGDWDGDGTDTVGIYDPGTGTFFLKNTNAPGPGDLAFGYGPTGSTPLAGDWNGDGMDTVGVYVSSTGAWFLKNSNSPGGADVVFAYGPPGVTPLPGDWDGL